MRGIAPTGDRLPFRFSRRRSSATFNVEFVLIFLSTRARTDASTIPTIVYAIPRWRPRSGYGAVRPERRRPTRSSATQYRACPRPPRRRARGRPETRDRETRRPPYAHNRQPARTRGLLCESDSHPSAATPRGFRKQPCNRHTSSIFKPRRTSRANNTAPCQHFTSTNSHTRVFCLLTRKPHQSKKTSMKNRSRTRHVMVQSIGDTSGICVKVNILACPPRSRSHAATDDDSRPADRAGFCLNRCAHSPSVRRT
jgi:hypothetical protein